MAACSVNDLERLEMAAQVMLAPPTQVTPEYRKEAEQFFIGLRNNVMPFDVCRHILESTQNQFLMYQMAQILTRTVLKQWSELDKVNKDDICKYLINYPVQHVDIPSFVRAEIVRSAAVILKRGSLEYTNAEQETETLLDGTFLATITEFLRTTDQYLNALGLQIIESIASEFQTAWRTSDVAGAITWDFHTNAKRHFEKFLLKKLFQLSLSALSQLVSIHDLTPQHMTIIDRFLRVASIVLSWNFSPKLITIRLRVLICMRVLKTSTFRPPPCWREFFQDTTIITFFMQMHKRVRHNEDLCMNSMTCLSQLSCVMGDVLLGDVFCLDGEDFLQPDSGNRALHDQYVQVFTAHLIETFSEGLHDYEILPLSLVIYKLFTYHPIAIFKRFPETLLSRFIEFLSQTIIKLTSAGLSLDSDEDNDSLHEALHNLYQVWRNILRSKQIFPETICAHINLTNDKVIEEFLMSILFPPYGKRQLVCFLNILNEHMRQFRGVTSATTTEEVRGWQENMHWLLMLIGSQLQQNSFDTNMPEEFAVRCINGYKSGEFVRVDFEQFFLQCLSQPLDESILGQGIDPIALLAGHVISWFALEYSALDQLGANSALISPELVRTSLWVFGLLMTALTPREPGTECEEDTDAQISLATSLPTVPLSGMLSSKIMELALSKSFSVLTKLTGEEKCAADAIRLIISFAEHRAEALAQSDHLYSLLAQINLENLPSRRALIKSLVIIGSVVNSDVIRQRMYNSILEPLAIKFQTLVQQKSSSANVDTQLADLVECFSGVADAGQSDAAIILFRFLQPIFESCLALMAQKPESQLLVNSILEFFKTTADVLFFYIESSDECAIFHKALLSLIDSYKKTQLQKYHSLAASQDEEEESKTADLCTLIEILCHSVSKTFMPTFDGAGSVENSAKIALIGLEMLLPLMSENLLKIPTLCNQFFRLLLFISDLAPNTMMEINDKMMSDFLHCLRLALNNDFGMDRLRASLEIISNLASQFCIEPTGSDAIRAHLSSLVNKVFEAALHNSCEVEIFGEASNALYSLICLNKENFSQYVQELLQRPENVTNASRVLEAFSRLLPSEELSISRMEKRAFHERLDRFLVEIHGLICL
ncbi:exportin-4 [Ditylenchus destructor]|uniref:Exportin-4 n=1 Tax=Ditylenchus destructor TaxID=166010 RepID=A0AAD4NJ07_9BILA|nr:exportin-4 [Ditylenchus destructor]